MPATVKGYWAVTDHICTACFGRVLRSARSREDVTEFRCSNCGATGTGTTASICWCGHSQPATRGMQRFKCRDNENPTPEFPAEVEVVELR